MKSEKTLTKSQRETILKTLSKRMTQTSRKNDDERRTSILIKQPLKGEQDSKYSAFNQIFDSQIIIGSTQKNIGQLVKQKSEQQLKGNQQQSQRKSVKDIDGPTIPLKDGDTYKSISPKIIMENNKINVHFVSAINKYHITSEQNSPKKELNKTEKTIVLREVEQSRVYLTSPKKLQQQQNCNTKLPKKIPKNLLSDHKSLILSSKKLHDFKTK